MIKVYPHLLTSFRTIPGVQPHDSFSFYPVTIDPHKAGFCPYPAGALLYRNGTMKGFITLAAPEVFHSPNDLNVGVYGLEGSKPGAAACGVLLSHEVKININFQDRYLRNVHHFIRIY